MSNMTDVARAMSEHGHKVPPGSHVNKTTGEQWCYCENCEGLGAHRADGTMYGKATKLQCANPSGKKAPPRIPESQLFR